MRERHPCVYIMASGRHGTIYIGVTSDLMARVHQHREGLTGGFTRCYGVKRLVFHQTHASMEAAITRKRDWKIALIEKENRCWEDWAVRLGFRPLP